MRLVDEVRDRIRTSFQFLEYGAFVAHTTTVGAVSSSIGRLVACSAGQSRRRPRRSARLYPDEPDRPQTVDELPDALLGGVDEGSGLQLGDESDDGGHPLAVVRDLGPGGQGPRR